MICVCMVMFSVVVGLFVISSLGWYNKVIVIMICWCMLLENLCGYIFMCLCVFGIFIVLSICIDFLNVLVDCGWINNCVGCYCIGVDYDVIKWIEVGI